MKRNRLCPLLKGPLATEIRKFSQERPHYENYATALQEVLARGCEELGVLALTQARAKAVPSFAGKAIRKIEKYEFPSRQLTDLCGARVIAYTQSDVQRVCEFIRENFHVDEANSQDTRTRLKAEEFGYTAVHYVVQLRADSPFASRVLEELSAKEQKAKKRPTGFNYFEEIGSRKAEIQVCTFLQHVWAALSHDRVYKADLDVPEVLKRHLARVAALLEESDEQFGDAVAKLDSYQSHYRAYLKPQEIRHEIEKCEMVQQYDQDDPPLAHKIAGLAMAVEDYGKAVAALEPFRTEDDAAILRDLGRSKCRLNQNGRPELERAAELNPDDADVWRYLGDSYASEDPKTALECYETAFRASPTSPHVLASYLNCRIPHVRNVDFIPLMYPALEAAVQECRELAAMKAHLPEAFFHAGTFHLLLNRPYESLAAFAKALALSGTAAKIETALQAVEGITQPILDSIPRMPELEPLEWAVEAVSRFLRLAIPCKQMQRAEHLAREAARKARQVESLTKQLDTLEKSENADEQKLTETRKSKEKAAEEAAEAKQAAEQAKQEADPAVTKLCGPVSAELEALSAPVVMVVGGCDPGMQAAMESYREAVQVAFEGFQGALIGGGTHQGISGIVGDVIANAEDAIRGIAYCPHALPRDATPYEEAYELHETAPAAGRAHAHTDHFTPLEPIQAWIDLVASGISPSQVRVLVINGGPISGFECRMALALGAQVAVIESSGRVATELHEDAAWWLPPHLIWLPADPACLRAFVNPGACEMDEAQLEEAGRAAHECYLEENWHENLDPAMKPWTELSEEYQASNRQQAAYAEQILRKVGYRVREAEGEPEVVSFAQDEIEQMAELEHGRWMVEKLRNGWTYGPERDNERKTTPHLVGWDDLPEEIKNYDRKAVRKWPRVLARANLEIDRP